MAEVKQLVMNATGVFTAAPGQLVIDDDRTQTASAIIQVEVETSDWTTPFLSEEADPVLARLWNNEDDAVYDSM